MPACRMKIFETPSPRSTRPRTASVAPGTTGLHRRDGAWVTLELATGEGARELRPVQELAAERAARALAADDDLHVVGDIRLLALVLDREHGEPIGAVLRCRSD